MFPVVGEFRNPHRKTIRADVNPYDKSTIVSIYPKTVEQINHTLQPGKFIIPAGTYDKPSVLVIGSACWWRDYDETQPLLEIPVSSVTVADSIVRDYCNGLFGCDMVSRMPGLFFIPGKEVKPEEVKINHRSLIDKAYEKQKNWYRLLVQYADSLWARSSGNPLAIMDDMRLAARELGVDNKEWLGDYRVIENVRCVACGSLRNPQFPVCPTCHAIVDEARAKELKIKFAE